MLPKPPVPRGKFFCVATAAQKIFPDKPLATITKSLEQIQSYDMSSLGPKWAICPERELVWKTINMILR